MKGLPDRSLYTILKIARQTQQFNMLDEMTLFSVDTKQELHLELRPHHNI